MEFYKEKCLHFSVKMVYLSKGQRLFIIKEIKIMKYFALLAAFAVAGIASAALPGDKTPVTPYKLQWVDCSPMPLGKINDDINPGIPDLRAVVFMYTRSEDAKYTAEMLDSLRRRFQKQLLIAIITPDNVSDAEKFRKQLPDLRVRLAVDQERKLTPDFMNNSIMLFPMAFLIDRQGTVLWRGEAVDLPEAVELQLDGKLSLNIQKKVDPMIYKMQQSMRDGNMFKALESAVEILKVDPGNPAALRMAVFTAESLNQVNYLWQIINHQLTAAKHLPRVSFTALDLIRRRGELRKYLPHLIDWFAQQPYPSTVRCAFADNLLNGFPFDAQAVLGAEKILASTPMPINALPSQMGQILAVRARLKYAYGDLKAAEADLAEAVEYFKHAGEKRSAETASYQLQYFRTLIKHLKMEQ